MKHAGATALDELEDLLSQLRRLPLRERSRGVFYFRSRPFLHFHEDPSGLYADVRMGTDFVRRGVNSRAERTSLLKEVRRIFHVSGA